jgi:hypothetical protein
MIKEQLYIEMADEFGTIVGVANIIGYQELHESKDEDENETFKQMSDELDVNAYVLESIYDDRYQELQKELYLLNKKRDKRLKQTTIYKRAFLAAQSKDFKYE